MDMLGFLRRVLPTDGLYCRFSISANGLVKRNKFYQTVEDLESAIQESDQQGQNTYYAISSFDYGADKRTKNNVHRTRILTLDVDCGPTKAYANYRDGLRQLLKFIIDTKLPRPLIVRSGNGLHVYWVLDVDLAKEDWIPLAEALKSATSEFGFNVDRSLIANSAQVLRPVDTCNYKDPKNPKRVSVLIDGNNTTVDAIRTALSYYYAAAPQKKPKNNSLLDNLSVEADFPTAVGSIVASKCAQIGWAVEHQDRVPEPLWYAVIGVAAYCEQPEDTARRWSQNHPQYSEGETLKKMAQWRSQATGPTTCAKFESERPVGCKNCPYAGKIGSPARLGVRYQEVDTSAAAPKAAAVDIPIPKPFKRASKGIVATIDGADTEITSFDIYPLGYGYDEHLGYEVAQYMWNRPHVGWSVLTMRQAYLADGTYREFVAVIADQGIVLPTRRHTELFQVMLRAYMDELRKIKTTTNHYATMGWKENNTVFVLGDDLYRRKSDGSVQHDTIKLATHINRASSDMFTTNGDFSTWNAGTEILRRGKLYPHQFSIGLGFASVLMQFTGLKGVTVSFYGPSGSGKTLAQLIQQSVWGDPEKLHFQSKFTHNALFSRFGLYNNLPMTVDEATQMTDKDVGDYLYWVSQGRDKARLTRSAEERASKEWALISTLSTNKAIANKLIATGNETDAQFARLLELRVLPSPLFRKDTDVGRKLYRLFTENYGHAGRVFLEHIIKLGEQGVRALLTSAFDDFQKRHGEKFTGVERFWEATFVLVELALKLAHEWGIIAFSEAPSIQWGLGQLDSMRRTVRDNHRDMFDLLTEYINTHLADTLLVFHEPNKEPRPNYDRLPRGPIRIRIDGRRKAGSDKLVDGTMFLERKHFQKWFAENGGDFQDFVTQLVRDGADATPKHRKASLGKNTPISLPQCYVVGVSLKHPRLQAILEGIEQQKENVMMGDVISIRGGPYE